MTKCWLFDGIQLKQSSSNYMTNELCDVAWFVTFTLMTDTNDKFVNEFLIYAKTKFKEFGKNGSI